MLPIIDYSDWDCDLAQKTRQEICHFLTNESWAQRVERMTYTAIYSQQNKTEILNTKGLLKTLEFQPNISLYYH